MDASRFPDSPFGRPTRQPGERHAFTYYLPKPLPRHIDLSADAIALLSEADASLGLLHGLEMLIPDPGLLIGPYLRREALASSQIEGTQASLSEVLQAEVDADAVNDDTAEVLRYLEATDLALSLLQRYPITQRLILPVHAALLKGVRGEEKAPGEFRRSPVWVGRPGATPTTAAFVPPLPEHIADLLADWERFVNDDGRALPALVQAALAHYQFETIHPFLDGNGRIGRLLITVMLMERDRLSHPLLSVSSYFEAHRDEYYSHLQAVREAADIDGWLRFFFVAVRDQSDDAVARSRRLIGLREQYHAEAIRQRSNLPGLVDLILRNPYLTVKAVETRLGMTNQGARNLILNAESRGWLHKIDQRGHSGQDIWFAPTVMDILETPPPHS